MSAVSVHLHGEGEGGESQVKQRLLALAAVPALLAVTAAPCAAAWFQASLATATAAGDQLATPAAPDVTVDGDTVTVSWSPPAGGAPAAGWRVTRGGAVVCTTTAALISCTDQPPAATPVRYAVRAVLESWESTPSPESVRVTAKPAAPFTAAATEMPRGRPSPSESNPGPGPEQAPETPEPPGFGSSAPPEPIEQK